MVQGTTKGLQAKAANNARRAHKAAANTKKGRRTVAPKKAPAIKQASMHKVGPRFSYSFPPSVLAPPTHSFSYTYPTEWCDAGTQRQDKQVRRTTDGQRRFIRQAHDHEICRHREVSPTVLHHVVFVLVLFFLWLFLFVSYFYIFRRFSIWVEPQLPSSLLCSAVGRAPHCAMYCASWFSACLLPYMVTLTRVSQSFFPAPTNLQPNQNENPLSLMMPEGRPHRKWPQGPRCLIGS